jgi:hypothetical protein
MFNKIDPIGALLQAPTSEYQVLNSAISLKSGTNWFELWQQIHPGMETGAIFFL